MDDATWAALALTLTVIFAAGSWLAYQRRGLAAGLKGAGVTLLPAAAYLTDTLQMFTRLGTAVGDWATGLVLSPTVWIGIVLTGLAVLLLGAGRALDTRRRPAAATETGSASKKLSRGKTSTDPVDGELDEIEALLRKRGIT